MLQRWSWCLFCFAGLCGLFAERAKGEGPVDYERHIKPILTAKCYACHGALKQESGLRLDTAALAIHGGDSGPALVAGKPDESLILARVSAAEVAELMPPEGEGEKLKPEQLELLKAWIAQGAVAPEEVTPADPRTHWAYQIPVRPAVPMPAGAAWIKNPIDAFIAAGHEKAELKVAPPAEKHVLLRRVYLDLIGLPPTRTELQAYLADESPEAYEKVVEQLLASPRYGERWGRHWMDVWRYSDWSGFGEQIRNSQRHIWHWRDWIIESVNADKPYDRMVVEMLAGDEIAPNDPNTIRATGYLARSWFFFNRNTWLEATVEHSSKAFLGMTINCAKCHDHKYDPLTQKEFYQLRAIFEPHDVRTDRLPGEADVAKGGLPRVYDAKAETPTYLFVRGSEILPDKEHPLPAAVPKALGGEFKIEPVALPVESYYPYLNEFVVNESQAAAAAGITKANEELVASKTAYEGAVKKLAEFVAALPGPDKVAETAKAAELEALLEGADKPAAGEAEKKDPTKTGPQTKPEFELEVTKAARVVALCEQTLLTAQAAAASIMARIAADRAKLTEPAPPNAQDLALAAGRAERELAWRNAEVALLTAQQKLAEAELTGPAEDPKTVAAVGKVQPEVDAALKALETAKAAVEPPNAAYTALGTMYPKESTGRRTAFAKWIADKRNPLTARVAVNHIWLRHVGSPLVPNVFDFGLRSPLPRHADLLDWLAVEFMESGWSMKHLHRLIVTSNFYRLASAPAAAQANIAADPDNHFLWRMNGRRLEAEAVRDSVLYVAGNLDIAMGGPDIDFREGLTSTRRSVYFRHAYEKQMKFLELFDAASVNECYRRSESIVPQQALALANSTMSQVQARLLAASLNAEVGADANPNQRFVSLAFVQILGRQPTSEESGDCQEFLTAQTVLLANVAQLTRFEGADASAVKPAGDPAQRAKENLIHVLLNHNDFVTIR
jgi:hypothetical protein